MGQRLTNQPHDQKPTPLGIFQEGEMKSGPCSICLKVEALTKHHIAPKSVSRQLRRSKPDGKHFGIVYICRPCHDIVHSRFTNQTLACLSWGLIVKEVRRILKGALLSK